MSRVRNNAPAPPAAPAFTLLELITVLVILGVISAIALPRYGVSIANQRLDAAARRVAADITLVQRKARVTGTSFTISFDPVADRYTLKGFNDIDHPGQTYVIRLGEQPYLADIMSASFGGDSDIVFDMYGVPDSTGSVVLSVGGQQQTVEVDGATGRTVRLPPVGAGAQ